MDSTILISAIGVMGGAVAVLWQRVERMVRAIEAELKDCKRDREALRKEATIQEKEFVRMMQAIWSGKLSETQRIVLEAKQ